MAFKISKNPTFTAKVTVVEPKKAGTIGHKTSSFNVEFKYISGHEELAVMRRNNISHVELLEQVVVGWSEFLDAEDRPVPFGEVELQALLTYEPAVTAMALAFWGSIYKAPEKNV